MHAGLGVLFFYFLFFNAWARRSWSSSCNSDRPRNSQKRQRPRDFSTLTHVRKDVGEWNRKIVFPFSFPPLKLAHDKENVEECGADIFESF